MNLKETSKEIRDIVSNYQSNNQLSFVEDTHTYSIKDKSGNITQNMPSVSTVLKSFYPAFDATATKSFQKCEGDPEKEKALLAEWAATGDYATNMGSRVHYILEQKLVNQYGDYKDVRKPIFKCDEEQTRKGDSMIKAGESFIDLMHERGAVLLDTEMVLGNIELGYFGQPDKTWLINNKENELGIIVTDWKTNQPKNFEVHWYTKMMLSPFEEYHSTDLYKYSIQLPLYAKLLLKMLEGSKYSNIKLFGCIITLLKEDSTFSEYRVSKKIINTVMNMNVKDYIK